MRHFTTLLLVLGLVVPAFASSGAAPSVFLTVEEALALAFGEAKITRETHYLTDAQLAEAKELAKVAVPSAIARPYVARDVKGKLVGTAWFDTHVVRSKKETVMFVVSPKRTIARLEVLAFGEPQDYLPAGKWYAQFVGKALGPELSLKRDIRPVTGATLTAVATTEAARRALALHEVVFPATPPEPTPEPVPDPEPRPTPAPSPDDRAPVAVEPRIVAVR